MERKRMPTLPRAKAGTALIVLGLTVIACARPSPPVTPATGEMPSEMPPLPPYGPLHMGPPPPSGTFAWLNGSSVEAVAEVLGRPNVDMVQDDTRYVDYVSGSCRLNLFFDARTNIFYSMIVSDPAATKAQPNDPACLRSIKAERGIAK